MNAILYSDAEVDDDDKPLSQVDGTADEQPAGVLPPKRKRFRAANKKKPMLKRPIRSIVDSFNMGGVGGAAGSGDGGGGGASTSTNMSTSSAAGIMSTPAVKLIPSLLPPSYDVVAARYDDDDDVTSAMMSLTAKHARPDYCSCVADIRKQTNR